MPNLRLTGLGLGPQGSFSPLGLHFYQQAVHRGLGHAAVVKRVITADLVLIGCGWAAENGWGVVSLAASAAVVAFLLTVLARGS